MQMIENPAVALREQAASRLEGMLRWDRSGRALLVCDMPRRAGERAALAAAESLPARVVCADGLLYIDLLQDVYGALLFFNFYMRGEWRDEWFEAQALLTGILCRDRAETGDVDEALLRHALLSCAMGERAVRGFIIQLRGADAAALRTGGGASGRASAALLAHWLWTDRGVGLPQVTAHGLACKQ